MCGVSRPEGGRTGKGAGLGIRGAGTGALTSHPPRKAPAGRDRRGFPDSLTGSNALGGPAAPALGLGRLQRVDQALYCAGRGVQRV